MIWAGIVIYNPNLARLTENIDKIYNKVSGLILYDNGSDDACKKYFEKLKCNNNVLIIGNGENKGIAFALNRIMETADNASAEWVITFDQDSIAPTGLIEEAQKRIDIDDVAIICPKVVDKRRIYPANKAISYTDGDEYVNLCITSGSCTRIKAWKEVGQFDDSLFIDLVDNDFCKRIILNHWKILRMNGVELDQEFGNIVPRNKKIISFFRWLCPKIPNQSFAANLSKLAYKKNVSPMRVYYTNRNIIYLNKKYSKYGGIGYESYGCKSYPEYFLFYNLANILRGKNKGKILSSIIKGVQDGKKMADTIN